VNCNDFLDMMMELRRKGQEVNDEEAADSE
jgi:hypothetical protein